MARQENVCEQCGNPIIPSRKYQFVKCRFCGFINNMENFRLGGKKRDKRNIEQRQ